jgi:uncharacterized protein (DUF1684 family)
MKRILILVFLTQLSFGFAQRKFDLKSAEKFQKEINVEYADANTSPLTVDDLATFKSLEFYPINEKFFVTATFVRTAKEKPFGMKTSTERTPTYVKYGEVRFTIDGQPLKLNIYKNIELSKKKEFKNYLFLPFSDLTSGNESYVGGKYIDLKIPKGNKIAIDFNSSYNPYCAYNHKYSCPIVPLENDLNIEIRAGVKKFHD